MDPLKDMQTTRIAGRRFRQARALYTYVSFASDKAAPPSPLCP